jgi:hypothetical protein
MKDEGLSEYKLKSFELWIPGAPTIENLIARQLDTGNVISHSKFVW